MSLLDQNITNYEIILKHRDDYPLTLIKNENGELLGKIQGRGKPKLLFYLAEQTGNLILSSKKEDLNSKHYLLRDKNAKTIGEIYKKGILHKKYTMNKDGILVLTGEDSQEKIKIKNLENKIIAAIRYGYEDVTSGIGKKENYHYDLIINDSNFNRLTLLGFYLSTFQDHIKLSYADGGPGDWTVQPS